MENNSFYVKYCNTGNLGGLLVVVAIVEGLFGFMIFWASIKVLTTNRHALDDGNNGLLTSKILTAFFLLCFSLGM